MLFWFLLELAVCRPQFDLTQLGLFLLQYGETTLKEHKLSCDVSVGSEHVLCAQGLLSSSAPGASHAAMTQWLVCKKQVWWRPIQLLVAVYLNWNWNICEARNWLSEDWQAELGKTD